MNNIYIKDFTRTPGARYISDGPFSGESFRNACLKKHFEIENTPKFCINLDGVAGYPASFLEEAFGGLAREFGSKRVLDSLTFVSNNDPSLIDEITNYIKRGLNE